jgi:hypothetical protein
VPDVVEVVTNAEEEEDGEELLMLNAWAEE